MSGNTKQSEDTYIRWSVNMKDAIQVGQFAPEPILIIHPDGRVTTSSRLKPDEISALVLDQIKTQWLKDAQCTKIRELEDRIKRLEEAGNALLWHFCPKNTGDISFLQSEAIKQWNKSKEAKL